VTLRRKILVVGSGGREHALALRLLESESVGEVVVTPGNAGTTAAPPALAGKVLRNAAGAPLDVAERERPDLVVVGPEAPLCAGLVDDLGARGLRAFGPSRRAAQLEGSKAFMKAFAARHGLPTARHETVADVASAERAIASFSTPPVVKADGLASGKGVVVATTHEEALAAARGMLSGTRFGEAGKTVVLEERLPGAELSLHAVCDGERFFLLSAAQDHKRLLDADQGPNTGGMGTYAPAPLASPALLERARREIIEPALRGMALDGNPYVGALFAGIMVTPAGDPMLLEFNVRFGDPETQVLMSTLRGDLAEALDAAARGALDPGCLEASGEHAVCVVLAAPGYPDAPRTGGVISGLDAAAALDGVRVFHAGTKSGAAGVETSGGRVLGVTGIDRTLGAAHARAYAAVQKIGFEGMQFRSDIAARALAPSSGGSR
jgi:phosphoribosylamine---glycine ligase